MRLGSAAYIKCIYPRNQLREFTKGLLRNFHGWSRKRKGKNGRKLA